MSLTPNEIHDILATLEGVQEKLRGVATGDDYSEARAHLYLALAEAKKVPELQDLTSHIEAVRNINNQTFTGDVRRSLLMNELETFIQEVKMKAEA